MRFFKRDDLPIIRPIRRLLHRYHQQRRLRRWRHAGCPAPPPHIVKCEVVLEHARRYGSRVLVETGTYRGDMVEAMRRRFDRVYSIELSETYYKQAVGRFRGCKNVELILGDSSRELPALVARLDQPTLFWLDGHYSAGDTAKGDKETPIYEELDVLLPRLAKGDVLLIDDARLFGVDTDYPPIEAIRELALSRAPSATVEVENDIIRIVNQASARVAA